MNNLSRNERGISLMEMLVVMVILGAIFALISPRFFNLAARAKYAQVAADIRTLVTIAKTQFTDQEAFANETLPGEMPSEFQSYISLWPKPPCPGWSYDWENNVDVNLQGFARITVRNGGDKAMFYRCVHVYGNSSACEDPGDFIFGGQDISTLGTKVITCQET